MKLDNIVLELLKEHKTLTPKDAHYEAEKKFSSDDYSPKRAAGFTPEKSIGSIMGNMAKDGILSREKIDGRFTYSILKKYGDCVVELENGNKCRAKLLELD